MCKLVLDRGSFSDFTSVSNIFIDEYMPCANGEFVKIYLHLLRLVNNLSAVPSDLSTERIADQFQLLDSDVMRALNYWSDKGLLSLSFNERNEISGIKFEPIEKKSTSYEVPALAKAAGQTMSAPIPESTGYVIPSKKRYTATEIRGFADNEDLKHLIFLAQTYLGKTLTPADINCILYMLEGLCFDVDFIEYIMETCISLGHKTLRSIEKQAVEYARRGIDNAKDAQNDEVLRRAIFKSIYKIFGLESKAPIKKEISYVDKWTGEYGFTDEIILEACNRTMEHTHTGSFQYADSILTNWFQNKALSLESIEALDKAHAEDFQKSVQPKKNSASRTKRAKTFEQRSYDYNDLEKKLLLNRDKKLKSSKNAD